MKLIANTDSIDTMTIEMTIEHVFSEVVWRYWNAAADSVAMALLKHF